MGIDKKNSERYSDPTAYEALKKISEDDIRVGKVISIMKNAASLGGFAIEGRIVLIDKKTGAVYR